MKLVSSKADAHYLRPLCLLREAVETQPAAPCVQLAPDVEVFVAPKLRKPANVDATGATPSTVAPAAAVIASGSALPPADLLRVLPSEWLTNLDKDAAGDPAGVVATVWVAPEQALAPIALVDVWKAQGKSDKDGPAPVSEADWLQRPPDGAVLVRLCAAEAVSTGHVALPVAVRRLCHARGLDRVRLQALPRPPTAVPLPEVRVNAAGWAPADLKAQMRFALRQAAADARTSKVLPLNDGQSLVLPGGYAATMHLAIPGAAGTPHMPRR